MSSEEPVVNPAEGGEETPATSAPDSKAKKPVKAAPKQQKQSAAASATKKSTTAPSDRKFNVGDVVLARLKGFPPWPARIADPENVPQAVAASRPSKNPSTYCVNYFPAGDFSWLPVKDINPLTDKDISDFLSGGHRKASGSLREAYETAQDPSEWLAAQEEQLRIRQEEELAEAEGVDQLEEEEGASGGKRKRPASKANPGAAKKAKGGKKAEEAPASKSKASKSKKATAPVSVPENQPAADDDPLASNPECVKVKDWRHKLQRAFLGKGLPAASEMDSYNELFNTIENYKDMTIEALQYSKIGKVMKKIATLEGIPRNDEFKLTDRASKLMNGWADFINAGGDKANGSTEANGNAEAPKSEKKEEASAAPAETTSEEKTEKTEEKPAEPAAAPATEETNGKAETEEAKEGEKMEVEA